MSAATVTVRYDGPILVNHQMDIADLAPALLGLSELCKIANQKFNGDKAAVKVLIGTDAEHQCFQLDLHIVQTLWDSTKRLLSNDDVGSAKNLLEWLGLLGTAGSVFGLFKLIKWLKGRPITSTQMEIKDGRDVVRISINGDGNNVLLVHPEALELLQDERVLGNVKKVIQPLTRPGYEKLEFEHEFETVESLSSDDAALIASLSQSDFFEVETDQPQVITVWVTVYSPVYDPSAPNWRFKFGDAHEYIDISETNIAEEAIRRGGAMVDDAYRVRLEIVQEHKPSGGILNHYKIKEVLEFRPARLPYQHDAFKGHTPG